MCQDSYNLLKKCLVESPILKYPEPEKSYTLFMDASKYAWACVLTQAYDHIIEGKARTILYPISYLSGLLSRNSAQLGCSYLRMLCYLYVCQEIIFLLRQC